MGARKIQRWETDSAPAPRSAHERRSALALVPQAGRWRRIARETPPEIVGAPGDGEARGAVHQSGIVPARRRARVLSFPRPAGLPDFAHVVRSAPSGEVSVAWRPLFSPRRVLALSTLFLLVTVVVAAIHYA